MTDNEFASQLRSKRLWRVRFRARRTLRKRPWNHQNYCRENLRPSAALAEAGRPV